MPTVPINLLVTVGLPAQLLASPVASEITGGSYPGHTWLSGRGRERSALYHELGLQENGYVSTSADRARLQALMHTQYAAWTWQPPADSDQGGGGLLGPGIVPSKPSPEEVAADGYETCALYWHHYNGFQHHEGGQTDFDWIPGPKAFRRVCAVYHSMAGRPASSTPIW